MLSIILCTFMIGQAQTSREIHEFSISLYIPRISCYVKPSSAQPLQNYLIMDNSCVEVIIIFIYSFVQCVTLKPDKKVSFIHIYHRTRRLYYNNSGEISKQQNKSKPGYFYILHSTRVLPKTTGDKYTRSFNIIFELKH